MAETRRYIRSRLKSNKTVTWDGGRSAFKFPKGKSFLLDDLPPGCLKSKEVQDLINAKSLQVYDGKGL